ncbi:MAG: site-specific DNA-methyltransferase [Pyrinomonadaceae bacterium]|nr:site-specific DNA-methyltransferase [Pyrinomonadaceae bacterium]
MSEQNDLMDVKEASVWASSYIGKNITPSNISYLITYGRVKKRGLEGNVAVAKQDLIAYYKGSKREVEWKKQLGDDLNWALSFEQYKESETTKHVHRLHPYKGKFIPQLVEYFLDDHTDKFKTETFFKPGDIVLDPFCGSGTTLVQANELGIHAIGVDVSKFNCLISNIKVNEVDFSDLQAQINSISIALRRFVQGGRHIEFESRLLEILNRYNSEFFPSPEFKIWLRNKKIDEKTYTEKHEKIVIEKFNALVAEFSLKVVQDSSSRFLDKWYLAPVREEIDLVADEISKVEDPHTRDLLTVILSRTIRSCRATTHADLATLIDPVTTTYYCRKHGKICKPLFSIVTWWERYCKDTFGRLKYFSKLKTDTNQICLNGNSESINIFGELKKKNKPFAELAKKQKIRGIFSSPPYVGLIDYHEQHAYAYDLFGFERKDEQEIGAMHKRQSKQAQADYVKGISNVLNNCKKYLVEDFDIFLVANDKFGLYPQVAENARMRIVNQFKRPVLNRTEKDKQAYSEIIFHLKREK